MVEFEKQWLNRVANSLTKNYGTALRDQIMSQIDRGGGSVQTTRSLLIALTKSMPEKNIHDTLTDCACFYPHDELKPLKELYESTGNLEEVHQALQEKFERDIVAYKKLSPEQLEYIVSNNWGVAGKLEGRTIIATKIPAQFHDYFEAETREERGALYCHCPRLKEAIQKQEALPYRYCYCGGGYYRDIWQYLTGKNVRITILKSILLGDDVCQFKIEIEE